MKKNIPSIFGALALLAVASVAFAGAYGEEEQAEELPTPPPPAAAMVPPPPSEESVTIMREFHGFMTDAETSRGVWAEIGSIYASETDYGTDIDFVNTFVHLSYGQEMWEVGALLPYMYYHDDAFGSDDGLGDLSAWGKIIPVRTDVFQLGGGLVATFPTGKDSFSTDEYGFEPFVTAAVAVGPTSLRGSFGYLTATGGDNDALDTNVALLAPIGDTIVLRGEVLWYHGLDLDVDPVTFAPGFDVRIPVGDDFELMLRPTGGVGITKEAPDWQLGLSIALAQLPS
jgi:hypothetical protein